MLRMFRQSNYYDKKINVNNKKPNLYLVFLFIFFLGINQSAFAQHDADSLTNILLTFNLQDNFKKTNIEFNDSTLDFFHRAEPTYKKDILPADLGNLGSAYISEIFFLRPDFYKRDFIFNLPYSAYLKNSENVIYFNTRRPYTSVYHTTSSKVLDLQTIDFIHTQNINPNWNFGIRYNFSSSLGQYLSEKKSLNSVGITTNYAKNKYALFVSYIYNKFNLENSGGYNDSLGFDVKVPEPFLKNSGTTLYNQELSVTQKFFFGDYKNLSYKDTIIKVPEPKISISHNLILSRRYKLYTDEDINDNTVYLYNYYQNFSYDSVAVHSVINQIKLGSEEIFEQKNKFGFSVILKNNLYKVYNFQEYIILQNTNTFFENQIKGEIYSQKFNDFSFNFSGNYYFSGYRKSDFRISTILTKKLFKNKFNSYIVLNADYMNMKPDYFENTLYSNHYIWENDFNSSQRAEVKLNYEMSKIKLNLNFNSAIIKNYVYYDITASPVQFDSSITILSGTIEKRFQLKKLVFENKVIWQYSSNDNIISLPELAAYQSTYFIWHYKDALLVHIGFDVYYSTEYKAYSYNPAVGQFYFINNTKKLAGNYPYTTLFADLKIKRNVLLFFKFSNMFSIIQNDVLPFYVNHYPIGNTMFKFGVKWTFKN